ALGEGWLDLLAPVGGGLIGHDRLVATCARVTPAWRSTCSQLRLPTASLGEEELADGAEDLASPFPRTSEPDGRDAEDPPLELAAAELRVLAVDDDPRILRLLEHHLRAGGYRVVTADDAASASIASVDRRRSPRWA